MKREVQDINDNIGEIGTSLETVVLNSAIPVVSTVAGFGWTLVRTGTEGVAGILDTVTEMVMGK